MQTPRLPRQMHSDVNVEARAAAPGAATTTLWLEAETSLMAVRYLGAATRGICAQVHCDQTAADLDLALVEAATNVVKHGFSGRPDGRLRVRIDLSEEQITIELHDNGPAFDPLSAPPNAPWDTDAYDTFETLPEGGFGIALVRALVDGCTYERTKDGNVLTLWKTSGQP